jgi:uncharacterized protein YjiS (DUF1127 family)
MRRRATSVTGLRATRILKRALSRRFKWLAQAWRHRRDLELLASFDDHMLADVGLTRADIERAKADLGWRDPTGLPVEYRGAHRSAVRWLMHRMTGSTGGCPAPHAARSAAVAVLRW